MAVVIVTDAFWGMYRKFCTNINTHILLILLLGLLFFFSTVYIQIITLMFAAIYGLFLLDSSSGSENSDYGQKTRYFPLLIFLFLLFSLPFFYHENVYIKIFGHFYEAGSFVFGGGHVVLPLLESNLVETVEHQDFLVGYALAQGVPGPMFSISSYLGAKIFESSPFIGALIATLGIFLPGFLLIMAFQGSFESYSAKPYIAKAIAGIHVAVVALMGDVLAVSVGPNAIISWVDLLVVVLGLYLFKRFKVTVLYLIAVFILIGCGLSYFSA